MKKKTSNYFIFNTLLFEFFLFIILFFKNDLNKIILKQFLIRFFISDFLYFLLINYIIHKNLIE